MVDDKHGSLNAPFVLPSPNSEPEDALMEPPPPPPSEPVQPVVASTDNQHTDYNTMQGPPIESPPPRMQVEMTSVFFDRGSSPHRGHPQRDQMGMGYIHGEASASVIGGAQFDLLSDVYSFLHATNGPAVVGLILQDLPGNQPSPPYAVERMLELSPARSELRRLPDSIEPDQAPHHYGQQGDITLAQIAIEKMNEVTSTLLRQEAAAAERFHSAMAIYTVTTQKMTELMQENVDLLSKQRISEDSAHENQTYVNWVFGHGVTPKIGKRATASQSKFDRARTAARGFGLWLTYNGTDEELKDSWVKFEDDRILSVDGLHLKNMLKNREEMSEDMFRAVVRVLRIDEAERKIVPNGNCHYVMHDWANLVLETGSIGKDSETKFLEPKFHYDIRNCGKVVVMIRIDDKWASISIDMIRGITHLIHPAESAKPYSKVLDAHRSMMEVLTLNAMTHMAKLANRNPPNGSWEYDVALKDGIVMRWNDSGVTTAYYSIPKNNQFLEQFKGALWLAKLTFIHSAVRVCLPITKKVMEKGKKPKKTNKKRPRDGKGKYFQDSPSDGQFSDGGSFADSNAV